MSKIKDKVIDDLNRQIGMIKTQCAMHSKVLDTLLEIIHEENLPITIEVGERHSEYDGSISIDILCEYEFKDSDVVNEAICHAINLTFDLVDN